MLFKVRIMTTLWEMIVITKAHKGSFWGVSDILFPDQMKVG